jgi:hypothetical protein
MMFFEDETMDRMDLVLIGASQAALGSGRLEE